MPNTRKKSIKVTYKDEYSEEDTGDFSDSGSEAHISEESGSDEDNLQSDYTSEEDYDTKITKKRTKSQVLKQKFTKSLFKKMSKQNETSDSELTYNIKDLTEEDKMLPCILNLSESGMYFLFKFAYFLICKTGLGF